MEYTEQPYSSAEVKVGSIIKTAEGWEREVSELDGRYIHFADGGVYSYNHPDLRNILIPIPKATKKRSSKKENSVE